MEKIDKNTVTELDRYFSPSAYVVSKLPNVKTARDFTEVYMKNDSGAYDVYKMVKGSWVLTNSNLNTKEVVTISGGGSGTDYSGDIAANAAAIIVNAADIDAIESTLHDYVEVTAAYTLQTAVGYDRKVLSIKNVHASNILTIDCFGAETIDSETSQDIGSDDCLTVMSNNTNWIIV